MYIAELDIKAAEIVVLLCQHLPDAFEYAWDELDDDEQEVIKKVRKEATAFILSLKDLEY